MNDKYMFDNTDNTLLDEQYYSYLTCNNFHSKCRSFYLEYDNPYLLEDSDFYPPYDNRVLESYVEDIDGGDNFADYCKYIFKLYEEEGYYD